MKIILNGQEINFETQVSISSLLDQYSLDRRKIAVEKNLEIIPRSMFDEVVINEGDNIEIIHFIGGG